MELLKKHAEPFESPDELLRRILSDHGDPDDEPDEDAEEEEDE